MKITVYRGVGRYTVSVDTVYNSDDKADCLQAEKYIDRILKESVQEKQSGNDTLINALDDCCCETGLKREEIKE